MLSTYYILFNLFLNKKGWELTDLKGVQSARTYFNFLTF